MANRAERRRSMKISELREQAIEAMNHTPYIEFEDVLHEDGTPFRVWHPLLVDDEAQTRIDLVQSRRDLDRDDNDVVKFPNTIKGKPADPDVIRLARAVLGADEHKKFLAAGGNSQDINMAWLVMQQEYEDAKEGEEDPK